MGADNVTLAFNVLVRSYRPCIGLAAAKIEALAFKVAWIPALVMLIVCCSMASWIATLSFSSILSNSSIKHMPVEKEDDNAY